MRTFKLEADQQSPDKKTATLLTELNPKQRDAAGYGDGPLLVIAGAGSGKTRVLTYRIAWLLAQKKAKPWNILALTFTNKAAAEMRERIQKLIGDDANKLWMGTFHSIFARILRMEADKLGYTRDFSIYDTDDSERTIKTIVKELNLDPKEIKPRMLRNRISGAKNQMITPDEYEDKFIKNPLDDVTVQVYKIYLNRLRESNAMDFDDLLIKPIELFRKHPEVLKKYQDYFRYLLIDEYQDTNRAQYMVAKMLASEYKNITVVGDDAQSIYSFRGADISNILNFKIDYPEAVEIPLEQNYRSTKFILKCADSVIKQNKHQLDKTLWTQNMDGEPITLLENFDQYDEANRVAEKLQNLRLSKGFSNNDFAVLYRTNYQSRVFEDVFRRKGINYQLVGSISFYQRKEIKDVVAYLKLLVNPSDEQALLRVINEPARGIGDKTMQTLLMEARNREQPVWDLLKEIEGIGIYKPAKNRIRAFVDIIESCREKLGDDSESMVEITRDLLDKTGYVKQFVEENTHESLSRRENVMELINAISEHEKSRPEATLSSFLQEISLYSDTDSFDANKPAVTLMTVHASKGLEFPVVFVAGLEENLFPMGARNGEESNIEEERRLFYVAITRAQKELFFSYAKSRTRFGDEQRMVRSRFLDEVDASVVRTETGATIRQGNRNSRQSASGFNIEYDWKKPIATGTRKSSMNNTSQRQQASASYDGVTYDIEDPSVLRPGIKVLHDKFGTGKIMAREGHGQDTRLTVFFQSHGQKKLMLRVANLKMIP